MSQERIEKCRCGKKPVIYKYSMGGYYIECNHCVAMCCGDTIRAILKKEVIRLWNLKNKGEK